MNHPLVVEIESTGYPSVYNVVGSDALGNELYVGDSILELDEERFLVDDLGPQAIEVLEVLGAMRKIAK